MSLSLIKISAIKLFLSLFSLFVIFFILNSELRSEGFLATRVFRSFLEVAFILLITSLYNPIKKVIFAILILHFLIVFYYSQVFGLLDTGMFVVILETNKNESFEFISNMDMSILSLTLLLTVLVSWLIKVIDTTVIELSIYKYILVIPFVLLLILPLYKFRGTDSPLLQSLRYETLINSMGLYADAKAFLVESMKPITPQWGNAERVHRNKKVYVVIIGESVNKNYLGIYNDQLNTTPYLNNHKSLTLVTDVISPATHTSTSIVRSLSINDKVNVDPNLNIIDLANMAGFETIWLSNQGESDSSQLSRYINRAKEKIFLSSGSFFKSTSDFELLKPLKDVLKQNDRDKIIFIHTVGSHSKFCDRVSGDNFPVEKSVSQDIGCYIQTIYKLDEFIHNVEEMLIENDQDYGISYFSDHSLVKIEYSPYLTHATQSLFNRQAVEVPMFFIGEGDRVINKTYFNRNFQHTFADWVGIKADQIDTSLSILNPRYVSDNQQYTMGLGGMIYLDE